MPEWFGVVNPSFQPAVRTITNIIKGFPTQVITGIPHLYIDGMIVRIDVGENEGMQQINQKFGPITIVNDLTFNIAIDSTLYDTFILIPNPSSQAIPFAEVNLLLKASVQNVLPGNSI